MPDQTPIYGLRFQELNDPPNGAKLGRDLAFDVEDELNRIDGDVATNASNISSLDSRVTTLEDPPAGFMFKNADQSIANSPADPVKVTFQDTEYDFTGLTDLANSRFVVPSGWAGIYTAGGQSRWAASGEEGSMRIVRIYRNGLPVATEQGQNQNSSEGSTSSNLGREILCSVGDVLELYAWQNSGGPVDLTTNFGGTWFFARWVRKGT